jgi:uncharacterized protein YkwD
MKYDFLGTLGVVAAVLGIAATAQADLQTDMQNSHLDRSHQVASSPKSTAKPTVEELESAIYNRVNLHRMSLDLPPLVIDPVISAQAKAHSLTMAKTGSMNHDGFRERVDSVAQTISYRSAAENVATNMGYKQPDIQAIEGWIESPGHYRNMIGRYDLTGIGVVQDAKGEYYFTQIFIRKLKQQ